MDKYYTPEIEEFYIGFEYEYEDINESGSTTSWYKTVIKENECYIIDQHLKYSDDLNLRVKYLSKEDIESLGWKGQESNSVYFTKDNYRLVHWITSDGRDINIFEKYDGGTQEECLIRKAKVKNKSELIKLLKQLNIG